MTLSSRWHFALLEYPDGVRERGTLFLAAILGVFGVAMVLHVRLRQPDWYVDGLLPALGILAIVVAVYLFTHLVRERLRTWDEMASNMGHDG